MVVEFWSFESLAYLLFDVSLEFLAGSLEDDPEDLLLSSLVLDGVDLSSFAGVELTSLSDELSFAESEDPDDLAASPELVFLSSALASVLDAEDVLLLLSEDLAESVFSVGVDTFAADAFAVELVEDFEVELVVAGLAVLDPLAALVLLTAGLITITL